MARNQPEVLRALIEESPFWVLRFLVFQADAWPSTNMQQHVTIQRYENNCLSYDQRDKAMVDKKTGNITLTSPNFCQKLGIYGANSWSAYLSQNFESTELTIIYAAFIAHTIRTCKRPHNLLRWISTGCFMRNLWNRKRRIKKAHFSFSGKGRLFTISRWLGKKK